MKNISLSLLLVYTAVSWAQPQSATVTLNKKQDVSNIIPLGVDGGFILHVSEQYAGREKNSEMYYFDASLTNKWQVSIDNPTNNLFEEFLIGSAFSNYVYYIQEKKSTSFSNPEYIITRIDKDGKKTLFSYKPSKEFNNSSMIAAYTDNVGMNFMVQYTPKVKKGETQKTQINIYQVKHDKKTFDLLDTKIKELLSEDEQEIFIEYLGHDDENVYLSQKLVSLRENAVKYTIYSISKGDYSIVSEDEFIVAPKNELVASTNLRTQDGARIYNQDYNVVVTSSGRTTYTTYYANAGSFGCAKLDLANGKFIIYGLTSSKKFVTPAPDKKGKKSTGVGLVNDVAGAYVVAFDINTGKELSKNEFLFNKDVPAKVNVSSFYTRAIWFDILADNFYRISVARQYTSDKNQVVYSHFVSKNEKPEYKSFSFPARKNETLWHMRFTSNMAVSTSFAPTEAVKFASNTAELRTKEYSKFGILLPSKIILAKNYSYTKTPKIEFTGFDIKNN
jgi:hypothetical protein